MIPEPSEMRWIGEPAVSRGILERRFQVDCDGREVPGILWGPEDATGTRPLVLLGHGVLPGAGSCRFPEGGASMAQASKNLLTIQ